MKSILRLISEHPTASVILALFLVLAIAYNLSDPLFEPPDEILHFRFIRHIQTDHELPIVQKEGPLSQDHQPPFYYALVAWLTGSMADEDIGPLLQINPYWATDICEVGDDNKNQYLHDPARNIWSDPASRAVYLTRIPSTLFGVGTVILIYVLALRFVDKALAAASMAVVAFTPNFLLTNTAVTNDSPVIFLTLASAVVMVRLIGSEREPSLRAWVGLSILFGMGMLTKLSFWPILPACATAIGLLAYRLKSWRAFILAGFILLSGVILITGWWAYRNIQLYGEWTGLSAMWETWGVRDPITPGGYIVELRNFRQTFWANFGYGNVPMPGWVYRATDLFMLGGAAGLVAMLIRRLRQRTPITIVQRDRVIFLVVWTLLTAFGLLWYMQKTFSVTGRQLFPVFPPIALGLVAGWSAWMPSRWHTSLAAALSCMMFLFATGALTGVLIPAYQPSPRLSSEAAEQRVQHVLNWQIGETARLIGYDLSAPQVEPGQEIAVTLYWEPLRKTDRNYSVFIHLFGENNQLVGARDTYPGLGNDPTVAWRPGEVIVDRIPVTVEATAQGPLLLDIEVGLYDLESGERLPISDAAGNPVGYPIIGAVKLRDPNSIRPEAGPREDWQFQGGSHLVDYSASPAQPQAGGNLTVTLSWGAAGPLPTSYKVFVHLVNDDGDIVAQADSIPLGGRYPTTAWGADERFDDIYLLALPSDLPGGDYWLLVGLYDPQTGVRLPLQNGEDHIRLDEAIQLR